LDVSQPLASDGEIDFAESELLDLNVEVLVRDARPGSGQNGSLLKAEESASSLPKKIIVTAADLLVEDAFSNGGTAEGAVPGVPKLLALPSEEIQVGVTELDAEMIEEVPTASSPRAARAPMVPPIPATEAGLPSSQRSRTTATESDALEALRLRRDQAPKPWFAQIFDEDYLRTFPSSPSWQTRREVEFVIESLALSSQSNVLDLGCGHGRHAVEIAKQGIKVTGIDLSIPLLIRGTEEARRLGVDVNFVHGDMRELPFENEFDGAYCLSTSFGYFDDEANRKVVAILARALKPGGKLLLDLINRDYIAPELPTRVWWQGHGCVVLEEVDFDYFSSRLQVQRSVIYEDGRQVEQEISIRAYSLHEIGHVLLKGGFRVAEVSGDPALRGKFFGAHSRQLIIVAEKF
jgi:SAM-dependent methyltransferase